MPGIKGMMHTAPKSGSLRRNIWRSMRILRQFTIIDLAKTSGARRENVRKFVKRLEVHGYIVQHGPYSGGRPGVFRRLRLVKDVGPQHPTRCDKCGRSLGSPCIDTNEEISHEDNHH